MANFSYAPTWTLGHGFAIGTEVDFQKNDSADSLTTIPYLLGGLQIFGGSINYNTDDKSGRSTLLIRIAIIGDPSAGDSGAGPGSILLVNRPLYVKNGENKESIIHPFSVQLNHDRLLAPKGGLYQMHMHADVVGQRYPTHMEIAMNGMWWGAGDTTPIGV